MPWCWQAGVRLNPLEPLGFERSRGLAPPLLMPWSKKALSLRTFLGGSTGDLPTSAASAGPGSTDGPCEWESIGDSSTSAAPAGPGPTDGFFEWEPIGGSSTSTAPAGPGAVDGFFPGALIGSAPTSAAPAGPGAAGGPSRLGAGPPAARWTRLQARPRGGRRPTPGVPSSRRPAPRVRVSAARGRGRPPGARGPTCARATRSGSSRAPRSRSRWAAAATACGW